jgi:hypothetical protein
MADAPLANPAAPAAPTHAAGQQAPPPPVGIAPPVAGAAQPTPAPPARRNRAPRGPVPASVSTGSQGAPALLELAAALPMHTDQRRSVNTFVPDANHLFTVLSHMDSMMNSTHRFTQSAPAWLPIVSHLYVSFLWITQILTVSVNSGYGVEYSTLLHDLLEILRVDEALVPGPLVPFFSALAAVNGPFEWIGDVVAFLPTAERYWPTADRSPVASFLRSVPNPFLFLDQLAHLATVAAPNNTYDNFEWYRNIFTLVPAAHGTVAWNRIGPHANATLFTTATQFDNARTFWQSALPANRFTRWNIANGAPFNWGQILGLLNAANQPQFEWFQHVVIVMQKYSLFFNGSVPLKSISPTGIGAALVTSVPQALTATRDWLYPANAPPAISSNRINPIFPIPFTTRFDLSHADHELEEVAEQYAILTQVNFDWSVNNDAQNGWIRHDPTVTHTGSLWSAPPHRRLYGINLVNQYAQLIASRYHQAAAVRST